MQITQNKLLFKKLWSQTVEDLKSLPNTNPHFNVVTSAEVLLLQTTLLLDLIVFIGTDFPTIISQ